MDIKEKISIIIITLNEEKTIGRLLSNLKKQTIQNYEIIVVDSNSEDKTIQTAKSYLPSIPELTIHRMRTRGASLGRNTGANLAKYEKILFLDSDVQLKENFLENLLKQANKNKIEIGSCYIKLIKFNILQEIGYGLTNIGFFLTQYFSPTAVGACILSSKTIHQKINGFDEEIYLCEDCDYVKRASKYGKFKMIPQTFYFDNRRMEFEGNFKTTLKYLQANLTRMFFKKELKKDDCKIEYKFGHYNK